MLYIYIYIYTYVRATPHLALLPGISRIWFSPFCESFSYYSGNLWFNNICVSVSSNWGPFDVILIFFFILYTVTLESRTLQSSRTRAWQNFGRAWVRGRPAMQCNAMQCKARQGNAMQCNAMQCNARQCNAMQGKARPGKARQGKARQGKARQGNAMQCNAVQCNAVQRNACLHACLHARLPACLPSYICMSCFTWGFYIISPITISETKPLNYIQHIEFHPSGNILKQNSCFLLKLWLVNL